MFCMRLVLALRLVIEASSNINYQNGDKKSNIRRRGKVSSLVMELNSLTNTMEIIWWYIFEMAFHC